MRAGAEKKSDPQMQKRDHPDQSGQAYVLRGPGTDTGLSYAERRTAGKRGKYG